MQNETPAGRGLENVAGRLVLFDSNANRAPGRVVDSPEAVDRDEN